jgi:hypothetical protein
MLKVAQQCGVGVSVVQRNKGEMGTRHFEASAAA